MADPMLNVLQDPPPAKPSDRPAVARDGLAPGVQRARWVVQGLYAAFLAWIGLEFARFVSQVVSGAPVTAERAPAV